jgi:hypothetical protein
VTRQPTNTANQDTQRPSGKDIVETRQERLDLLVAAKASQELRYFRGKLPLNLDVAALREDR